MLCANRDLTAALKANVTDKSLHNSRGDVLVYRKQIFWNVFSLLCFFSLQIHQCLEQPKRRVVCVSHGLSKTSTQPFLILPNNPSAYLLFCFFTAASKDEVPLPGAQEPGATFVTAQTGRELLAGL